MDLAIVCVSTRETSPASRLSAAPLRCEVEGQYRAGGGDVERLDSAMHGYRDHVVRKIASHLVESVGFASEEQCHAGVPVEGDLVVGNTVHCGGDNVSAELSKARGEHITIDLRNGNSQYGSGRSAHDLWRRHICGGRCDDNALAAGCFGCAQQCPDVSRVCDVNEYEEHCVVADESLVEVEHRHGDNSQCWLRSASVGKACERFGSQAEQSHAAHIAPLGDVRIGMLIARHDHEIDLESALERLDHQFWRLDDKTRRPAPLRFLAQQTPDVCNPRVTSRKLEDQAAAPSLFAASAAALADSTSAVNAPASVTARSARTLRSTSMPASLRPKMKRLYVVPF